MRNLEDVNQAIRRLTGQVEDLQAKLGRIGGLPQGVLDYAERTSDQIGFGSTEADIATVTVSVDTGGDRRIRVKGVAKVQNADAGAVSLVRIREDGTQLQTSWNTHTAASEVGVHHIEAYETPPAGTRTYKLTLQRTGGSGSLTMAAAATSPVFIVVEDVGPA